MRQPSGRNERSDRGWLLQGEVTDVACLFLYAEGPTLGRQGSSLDKTARRNQCAEKAGSSFVQYRRALRGSARDPPAGQIRRAFSG